MSILRTQKGYLFNLETQFSHFQGIFEALAPSNETRVMTEYSIIETTSSGELSFTFPSPIWVKTVSQVEGSQIGWNSLNSPIARVSVREQNELNLSLDVSLLLNSKQSFLPVAGSLQDKDLTVSLESFFVSCVHNWDRGHT